MSDLAPHLRGDGSPIDQFWKQACECQYAGATGGLIRQQLMWAALSDCRGDAWRSYLVAGTNRTTVENFLHPGSYGVRERLNRNGRRTVRRGSGAGRARLFTADRNWDEVLVVPYSSEPGQIVGMAFADAYETCPKEFVHRSFTRSTGGWREAGFGMLQAVRSQSKQFGTTAFVFLDLLPALRLQFKWLMSSSAPLPVLVAHDEGRHRTVQSWRQLASRQPVIIAEQADARLFRQASFGSAIVVIDPNIRTMLCRPPGDWPFRDGVFDPEEAERIFRCSYQPVSWLQKRERLARPWMDVLIDHLGTLSAEQAESLLQEIGLPIEERLRLSNGLRRACRGRTRWSNSILTARRIRLGERVIVEWDGAWIDECKRRRICDVVRVDRILEGFSTTRLEGRILGKTGETRFTANANEVQRRGLLAAVKKAMSSQGISWSFAAGWAKRGLEIATAFQEADSLDEMDTIPEVDVVGSTNASFRFPNLQITAQGFRAEVDPPFLSSQVPARNLRPPRQLQLRGCRPIAFDLPSVRTFWAVVRKFVAMAMAPTLRIDSPGVVLIGPESRRLLDALQLGLGCQKFAISGQFNATRQRERLQLQIGKHRWPSLIQLPPCRSPAARLVYSIAPRNCFAAIDGADRDQLRAAGWWTIDVLNAGQAAKLIDGFGRDVVLNYLHSYISRRFEVCFDTDRLEASLWEDVSNWFGKIGRGKDVRIASAALVSPPA